MSRATPRKTTRQSSPRSHGAPAAPLMTTPMLFRNTVLTPGESADEALTDEQKRLRTLLRAAQLAAPFALALNFDDDFAHSLEMSLAVGQVFRGHGVESRVLPAAIFAVNRREGLAATVGLTDREFQHVVRYLADIGVGEMPEEAAGWSEEPPEEENPFGADEDGGVPMHALLELLPSGSQGERAVFDATFGQLRQHGVEAPATVVWFGAEWPEVRIGDWTVTLLPCPRAEAITASIESSPPLQMSTPEGVRLREDVARFVDVALSLRWDQGDEDFLAALRAAYPEEYARAMPRLARFAQVDQGFVEEHGASSRDGVRDGRLLN